MEGKNLPVEHCIRGTHGWELNEKIAEALGDAVVIDKPTFGSTELAEIITDIGRKEAIEVELVGLCTDICVVSNALLLKANLPEVKFSVDPACCAGVTPDSHEKALNTMTMCHISVEW
jgi:nicotinamidase-related amidase